MPASFDPAQRFVVAIPARDEAARLDACLRALDGQRASCCDHIVVVLNNCTDNSEDLLARLRPHLRVPVTVATRQFAPSEANAGQARSHALALAADNAGPHGIVATTDADGVVARDWVARNRAAIARGAEAVCGRAVIDPVEAMRIAPALHEDDAQEVAYAALLDEIHGLVDPDPADPLPRHSEHSGASIAVTVAAYTRAGGMAPLPTGEDRGFLRALRLVDARIRHAPEVLVTVSGRLEGRAAGGMADTMARRMIRQDAFVDAELEPAVIALRRAGLRARARRTWDAHRRGDPAAQALVHSLEREAGLPAASVLAWMRSEFFGQVWIRLEAETPMLPRISVARAALDREAILARGILDAIRAGRDRDGGDPADMMADAAAHPR